jgi:L-aspartate oxidase
MDEDDLRTSLKALMWRAVGVERNGGNLTGALGAVRAWESFALRVGADRRERLALLNMLLIARLVTHAALLREESRGTHARRDHPARDDAAWRVRLVERRGKPMFREPVAPVATAGRVDGGGTA